MSFIRTCSVKIEEVYKTKDAVLDGWFGFNREASAAKTFEYDPENFLYYRARAITADKANENGDYFEKKELQASYKTFVGKGVFYNHDNEDPNKAFGLILDAHFVDPSNDNAYIEILAAVDKHLIEEIVPGLLRRVESGMATGTSMSCLAGLAKCSCCGNMARTTKQLCDHMRPDSLTYIKGRKINANDYAFEYNHEITFTEDSIVDVPADTTARIFEVYASTKDKLTKDNLDKDVIIKLTDALQALAKSIK